MKTAKVNDVELEYEAVGAGQPVLLISPVLADGFLPFVSDRALLERYRLIMYHKRGWAGSTHTAPPVTIGDHAADAAGLLDHLGVDRAHIAGHSSGAAVALQLAVDRPEMVQTLALLELSLLTVPSAEDFLQQAAPAFDAYSDGDHERAVAIFLSAVSGFGWETCRAVIEEHVPGAVAHAVKDADTFFGIELPAVTEWEFGARQAAPISQPVLSVLGSDTARLWMEVADLLRSWFPQVEECTVEGVGHLLHIQRPEPVVQGVAEFLARHPLTAS